MENRKEKKGMFPNKLLKKGQVEIFSWEIMKCAYSGIEKITV